MPTNDNPDICPIAGIRRFSERTISIASTKMPSHTANALKVIARAISLSCGAQLCPLVQAKQPRAEKKIA